MLLILFWLQQHMNDFQPLYCEVGTENARACLPANAWSLTEGLPHSCSSASFTDNCRPSSSGINFSVGHYYMPTNSGTIFQKVHQRTLDQLLAVVCWCWCGRRRPGRRLVSSFTFVPPRTAKTLLASWSLLVPKSCCLSINDTCSLESFLGIWVVGGES